MPFNSRLLYWTTRERCQSEEYHESTRDNNFTAIFGQIITRNLVRNLFTRNGFKLTNVSNALIKRRQLDFALLCLLQLRCLLYWAHLYWPENGNLSRIASWELFLRVFNQSDQYDHWMFVAIGVTLLYAISLYYYQSISPYSVDSTRFWHRTVIEPVDCFWASFGRKWYSRQSASARHIASVEDLKRQFELVLRSICKLWSVDQRVSDLTLQRRYFWAEKSAARKAQSFSARTKLQIVITAVVGEVIGSLGFYSSVIVISLGFLRLLLISGSLHNPQYRDHPLGHLMLLGLDIATTWYLLNLVLLPGAYRHAQKSLFLGIALPNSLREVVHEQRNLVRMSSLTSTTTTLMELHRRQSHLLAELVLRPLRAEQRTTVAFLLLTTPINVYLLAMFLLSGKKSEHLNLLKSVSAQAQLLAQLFLAQVLGYLIQLWPPVRMANQLARSFPIFVPLQAAVATTTLVMSGNSRRQPLKCSRGMFALKLKLSNHAELVAEPECLQRIHNSSLGPLNSKTNLEMLMIYFVCLTYALKIVGTNQAASIK